MVKKQGLLFFIFRYFILLLFFSYLFQFKFMAITFYTGAPHGTIMSHIFHCSSKSKCIRSVSYSRNKNLIRAQFPGLQVISKQKTQFVRFSPYKFNSKSNGFVRFQFTPFLFASSSLSLSVFVIYLIYNLNICAPRTPPSSKKSGLHFPNTHLERKKCIKSGQFA